METEGIASTTKAEKESLYEVTEGKATIKFDPKQNIFYNPIQQINRDISVLALQAFINDDGTLWKRKKELKTSVLEAMAACGIRSIRYAKELVGIESIVANDYSARAVESIKANSEANGTTGIVVPSCNDCNVIMHGNKYAYFAVDIDPYGTPAPYLDAAVQCVQDGGILCVTATDMAVLAGNTAEACFAKYGSMSLKSKACHEMALRIMIHTLQTTGNRYGRFVEPLLSVKIDFYIRLFFRVVKGPERCKVSASNTSMVYQCTGCFSLNFQPIGITRPDGRFGFAQGPNVPQLCEICDSRQHIGGPMWTGPIHNKDFVKSMLNLLSVSHSYLNTANRIQGLLSVVIEEVEHPLLYDTSQLCSVLKCSTPPMLQFRSAIMNLGYEVSLSHVAPNTTKTSAPNRVIWDILRAWHKEANGSSMKPGTPGFNILSKTIETQNIDFSIREDANPASREMGILRYQMNPTRNWGPGVRDSVISDSVVEKRLKNQGKFKGKRKLQLRGSNSKADQPTPDLLHEHTEPEPKAAKVLDLNTKADITNPPKS